MVDQSSYQLHESVIRTAQLIINSALYIKYYLLLVLVGVNHRPCFYAASCQWILKLFKNWAKDPVEGISTKSQGEEFFIFIFFSCTYTCSYAVYQV